MWWLLVAIATAQNSDWVEARFSGPPAVTFSNGQQPKINGTYYPVVGILCTGTNCGTKDISSAVTLQSTNSAMSVDFGSANLSVPITQSSGPALCPSGSVLVSITCSGTNCATIQFQCMRPTASDNLWRNNGTISSVMTVFSTNAAFCGYAAFCGMECLANGCGTIRIQCCSLEMRVCRAGYAYDSFFACQGVPCQVQADPPNGVISSTNNNSYPSTSTLSCITGYKVSGNETRTCLTNSTWSGAPPSCVRVTCPTLAPVPNGNFSLSNNYTYPTNASFSCTAGYVASQDLRTCLSNGTWSGSDVICGVQCDPLQPPDSGSITVTNNYIYPATATLVCNTAYSIAGPVNATCGADGHWTRVLGTCVPGITFVLEVPGYNATATVYIPANPIFLNGTLVANISLGTNLTLSASMVSLVLEDESRAAVNVTNLSTPVSIMFNLKIPRNADPVSQCLGLDFLVAPVLPTCGFVNEATGQWDDEGCIVSKFNSTHVQCNCTHFTLFAVLSPKHNRIVPSAVLALTPENIAANPTGLITVILILCVFAVVFVAAALIDRSEAVNFDKLRLSKQEKWKKENRPATFSKQVKVAFQKRHTWFALLCRKSGTSFRSVDRTFVALLSAFASLSMSAFYHAQDNNDIARFGVILISALVCAIPSQLLISLFIRTGPIGFYEEWEQSRKPQTKKCVSYRFPNRWRHVWRAVALVAVIGMIVFVLSMSMNFDRQPFYFCQGAAAPAWVSTWLAAYAVSIFLVESLRIVLFTLVDYVSGTLPRNSWAETREMATDKPKNDEEETDE